MVKIKTRRLSFIDKEHKKKYLEIENKQVKELKSKYGSDVAFVWNNRVYTNTMIRDMNNTKIRNSKKAKELLSDSKARG